MRPAGRFALVVLAILGGMLAALLGALLMGSLMTIGM